MLGLAGSLFLASSLIYILSRKKFDFLELKKEKLAKKDKSKVNKFIVAMPSIAISGLFFGEIDILFLGYFVLSEFVGYYRAVLGLAGGITAIITLSAALLPVFSKLNKRKIERDFNKFLNITLLLSGIATIITLIFAPLIINIVYGQPYSISSNLLRVFSLVIISTPIIALYETYFISQEKPKIIMNLLIFSTLFNIILTYFLIKTFLIYGQLSAVYGAVIASIISRYLVMFGLIFYKHKIN
jgi:O-antigen/teichoic acid export membrane protein